MKRFAVLTITVLLLSLSAALPILAAPAPAPAPAAVALEPPGLITYTVRLPLILRSPKPACSQPAPRPGPADHLPLMPVDMPAGYELDSDEPVVFDADPLGFGPYDAHERGYVNRGLLFFGIAVVLNDAVVFCTEEGAAAYMPWASSVLNDDPLSTALSVQNLADDTVAFKVADDFAAGFLFLIRRDNYVTYVGTAGLNGAPLVTLEAAWPFAVKAAARLR